MRGLYLILVALFAAIRMDADVMPKGFETFDMVYSSFMSTLLICERHDNPTSFVFAEQMTSHTRKRERERDGKDGYVEGEDEERERERGGEREKEREKRKMKNVKSKTSPSHSASVVPYSEESYSQSKPLNTNLRPGSQTSILTDTTDMKSDRPSAAWLRTRNRFWLASMIHKIPDLAKMRRRPGRG